MTFLIVVIFLQLKDNLKRNVYAKFQVGKTKTFRDMGKQISFGLEKFSKAVLGGKIRTVYCVKNSCVQMWISPRMVKSKRESG